MRSGELDFAPWILRRSDDALVRRIKDAHILNAYHRWLQNEVDIETELEKIERMLEGKA